MRVLFAILVVAIAGLLWASVATAQHIRRARQRKRRPAAPPPLAPPPAHIGEGRRRGGSAPSSGSQAPFHKLQPLAKP